MAKQITFNYDNVDYTLEFTRRTVKEMEGLGFVFEELATKPMTMLPLLFQGSFRAKHKSTKVEKINEIYNSFGDKEALLTRLMEMYQEPLNTLMEEPDVEKKVEWTASW